MGEHLYVASQDGLFIAERADGAWRVARRGLAGRSVSSVVACEGLVLAGTADGVYRSDDDGATWREASANLTIRRVRWMARPVDCLAFVLAGTEPAGIYVSRNGGTSWVSCPEVEELRDAHGWSLPYSPRAGCVRGFAIHGTGAYAARAYAAVEVGGVLCSTDSGETWQLVDGSDGNPDIYRPYGRMIHPDVHAIAVHPLSPDRVTAATGGGLYRSDDGGATWRCVYRCYCRAAWVDPDDPAHVVFGPADGVSRGGRIEASHDGGRTWHATAEGLGAPWDRHMVERFARDGSELLAVLSNGELWSAPLSTMRWRRILADVPGVRCAAVYE
ncbi:MAG: hypothetical protein JXA09_15400 [Anaerolineae bacterium]|nr:hypothetical protein [Anaerolineae bacterium]